MAQDACSIKESIPNVSPQVRPHKLPRLFLGYVAPQAPPPQARNLLHSQVSHYGVCLLTRVKTKSAHEPWQSNDSGPHRAEAQQQVPVESELKAFIKSGADPLPNAPPPEQRLLRNK